MFLFVLFASSVYLDHLVCVLLQITDVIIDFIKSKPKCRSVCNRLTASIEVSRAARWRHDISHLQKAFRSSPNNLKTCDEDHSQAEIYPKLKASVSMSKVKVNDSTFTKGPNKDVFLFLGVSGESLFFLGLQSCV